MQNNQSKIISGLLFIIIVLLIVTVWLLVRKNSVSTLVSPDGYTQTNQNQNEPDYFPNGNPAINSGIYQNTKENFQIDLGSGNTFQDPNTQADGGRTFHLAPRPGVVKTHPYFRMVAIKTGGVCEPGVLVTANGITFTRIDEMGNYGGMMSGSIDSTYCVVHDGLKYYIGFSMTYQRAGDTVGEVFPTPDAELTRQKFDQELQSLHFQFLD